MPTIGRRPGDPVRPNYHEHATGEVRKLVAFPNQAEALRRLRKDRFQLITRMWCALGIVSGLCLLVSPLAWGGVGLAALGYFVTCVWSGYYTFDYDPDMKFPPTAPFDERNRYIRERMHLDDE